MRRGAAWPLAERPSSCLTARSAVSRTDRRPHREPAWDAEHRRRRPQEHGSASQRAPARRGGPGYPELALPCQPVRSSAASGVLCPVSGVHASSVHACDVHATGVQRPGVRCPVWASGVRCPVGRPGIWASGVRYPGVPRLLCPNRASSSSADPASSQGEDGRGRRGRPARYPRPAGRLPESEPDARSWRRPCWANGGVGLAVVVGRSSASGRARPPGRPGGAGCAGTARR